MTGDIGYRIRFRVRLGTALTSDASQIVVKIEGREVTIKSQKRDEPLRESYWILFSARGFESENVAKSFGERLRARISLAALSANIGVDVGSDKSTSSINSDYAHAIGLIKENERILGNVHGLMILPDDDLSRFPIIEAQGRVTSDPFQLTEALEELSRKGLDDLRSSEVGVRLLNFALMNADPLAKAVLSFSAVEALGKSEKWSPRQMERINDLACSLELESTESDPEILEIVSSLRRGLFRISLRQGVMRTLDRLELGNLKKEWDRLYGLRSSIFHGAAPITEVDLNIFSHEVFKLCAAIVLENAKFEGLPIPDIARVHFYQ